MKTTLKLVFFVFFLSIIFLPLLIFSQSITVTFPNGGEHWLKDTYAEHNIMWDDSGVTNFLIEFSDNNGSTWTTIESSTTGNHYSFTSPDIISENCLIRVSNADNTSVNDISDAVYSISDQTIYYAEWQTTMGEFRAELRGDYAPRTVQNCINLCEKNFYQDLIFHRVISNFMIQDGCPDGNGSGGPGYSFDDEFHPALTFDFPGVLGMANAGPNTNGSQYFITVAEYSYGNGSYSVYGRIVDGMDNVYDISEVDTDGNDKPLVDIVLSISIVERDWNLTLTNPTSDYGVFAGDIVNIEWDSDFIADVKIEFSDDNASTWTTLTDSIPSDNETFEWEVPNELHEQCFIKITSIRNGAEYCQNSTAFEIREKPVKLSRFELYENVTPPDDNPENIIVPGKSLRFKAKIKNDYTETLNALSAELTTESEYVTIVNGDVTFNSLAPDNEIWSNEDFEILLSEDIPSSAQYELKISITDDNVTDSPWTGEIILPVFEIFNWIDIDDDDTPDSQGNNNGDLDAGETIEMLLPINNKSVETCYHVYGQFSSPEDFITIWNEVQGIDRMVYDTTKYNNYEPITPNAENIQQENDFVFDIAMPVKETIETDFVLKLFGYVQDEPGDNWEEGGILLKWEILHIENTYITEIKELSNNNSLFFELFPSPATNSFYLKFVNSKSAQNQIEISIYNIIGVKVKTQIINITNNNLFEIDCSNLISGEYIVEVNDGTNIFSKKIIINNN